MSNHRPRLFRPKEIGSAALHAAAGAIRWNYDRSELIADGVVHIVGLAFGLVAATALIVLTGVYGSASEIVSVSIYAAGLLAMLGFSAAYNLWPVSRWKWRLRRFDHSAIYLLIAATYTPVIMQVPNRLFVAVMLSGIWSAALAGVAIKLLWPGRFDRLAVFLYLALGWSALVAYDTIVAALPTLPLVLITAGGALYTFGVIFHAWQRLRFQNAIWHGFVLLGAACHYTAVLDLVLA
jgi:hemolysin III